MEIWCDIKGYEGLYQVSNLGNIKSLERQVNQGKYGKTRVISESLMSPSDNGRGYLIVGLRNGKQRRVNHYIHRLVAEHFIENNGGFKYVNHKDFDPKNNRSDNLEWCTQEYNIQYSAHRMRKSHKPWKTSSTNEKYIYMRDGRFRLSIRNKIDKTFPTLSEAIKAREVVLSGEKYFAG